MVYLSVLSFTAAVLYFYVGFKAFRSNTKSKLFRIFFLLTLSMTIWSFASGFLYLAENIVEYSIWNKIGAFGWCTFEALVLYFIMVFTANKIIRYWYVKLLILIPAPIFLFMVLFLFGPNIDTKPLIANIFYIGNFLYNFIYLAVSIVLLFLWGNKSKSPIQKKQASIIALCSIIPFLLNLLVQRILPFFDIIDLPNMGQIFTLILFLGVNYAITRYQFMSIPTAQITYELFNELTGLTFLLDSQGYIMKANYQVYMLLGYREGEVIGKQITQVISNHEIDTLLNNCEDIHERMRFLDINISVKSGMSIPFNISIIPLREKSGLLRGILFIGEDIRATKRLRYEIVKHKQTNEKLQNSELLFRRLLEIAPISIMLISKRTGCIIYLNTQAVALFEADGAELIGSQAADCFVNRDDLNFLNDSFWKNRRASKHEEQLKRRNGSRFIGLVTMIPSIYHEEEVALSCVVDMTDQKHVEETLKKNNEYIKELNTELLMMNNNLITKSIRDGLTNLYNHQYINEILEKKLQEISSSGEKLCLMMLDIDHFKRVNDEFGHLDGDRVLASVADLIVNDTGDNDYIGRYGGEEFIALLPDIDLQTAVMIAEKVRYSIEQHDFGKEGLKVTISIGLVQYFGETPNILVNKADMLLYQAKHKGRNRVENQLEERMEY